jgi:hypothetical protein
MHGGGGFAMHSGGFGAGLVRVSVPAAISALAEYCGRPERRDYELYLAIENSGPGYRDIKTNSKIKRVVHDKAGCRTSKETWDVLRTTANACAANVIGGVER